MTDITVFDVAFVHVGDYWVFDSEEEADGAMNKLADQGKRGIKLKNSVMGRFYWRVQLEMTP